MASVTEGNIVSTFAERWKKLQQAFESSGDDEWWAMVFARPLANVFLLPIADIRWITPNLLTWFAFALGALGIGLMFSADYTLMLWGIGVIQVRCVVDSMDGHLARYRGQGSAAGAFLDKTTDALFWTVLFFALAYAAYQQHGHQGYFMLAGIAAFSRLFIGYVFWLNHYMQLQVNPDRIARAHTYRYPPTTIKGWLWNFLYMFNLAEPDLYFWISVAIVLNRLDELMWFLAIGNGVMALIRLLQRGRSAWLLDKSSAH